jgi:hypothetical protein
LRGICATLCYKISRQSCFGLRSLMFVGEKAGKFEAEQTVKTADGARTMGFDPETRTIFLPTAQMTAGANREPTPKPGTFEVIVVGQP